MTELLHSKLVISKKDPNGTYAQTLQKKYKRHKQMKKMKSTPFKERLQKTEENSQQKLLCFQKTGDWNSRNERSKKRN